MGNISFLRGISEVESLGFANIVEDVMKREGFGIDESGKTWH